MRVSRDWVGSGPVMKATHLVEDARMCDGDGHGKIERGSSFLSFQRGGNERERWGAADGGHLLCWWGAGRVRRASCLRGQTQVEEESSRNEGGLTPGLKGNSIFVMCACGCVHVRVCVS